MVFGISTNSCEFAIKTVQVAVPGNVNVYWMAIGF
jgi:hypothetical protein